ncbi:MAG: F0F1 ATP synthase subunit A [Alphaproteobacteria bacterium]|jgi:F-type H+-transporting ATPase subunit a|nr:F0F1 ATP synthase subunit A [Alphaproteobacteria bacterium]MDP6811626.1 F0F1 ATP synthase subunit A [Alphaproteobacteria bacterium]
MHQFVIGRLSDWQIGGLDISFSKAAAFMIAAVIVVTLFLTLTTSRRAMVPGRWQSVAELWYEFIANMIKETIGTEGRKYFPFVFTIFSFIVICNLVGMLPYSYTVTSHIAVTITLALAVFILVTVIGLTRHGLHFLSFFVPKGVPAVMLLLVVPIEVLSYFMRPISHSVRLFANMTAGHTMLKVFGGFVVQMGIFGVLPFALIVALTGLEIAIAVLQAYVFTILTCLYLNDAIHLEH